MKPIPLKKDRAAARLGPSVMTALRRLAGSDMGATAYEDWFESGSGKAPEILAKAAAARPGVHNGSGFLLPVSECLMAAVLPEINYLPEMPADSSRRIAIAGAGAIVTGAHLPAYALAGFNVAGIWNRTRARAEAAAQRFGIERVYENVDQLVADDSVEIVDIALIPDVQLEIVQAAAAAGKHILCQKPLHEHLAPARAIVECCQAAGVKLNVNQQLRHDARMRSVAALFDKDLLGRPTRTMFDTNIDLDYDFPAGSHQPRTQWRAALLRSRSAGFFYRNANQIAGLERRFVLRSILCAQRPH